MSPEAHERRARTTLRTRLAIARWAAALTAAIGAAAFGLWQAYTLVGRTPGELLDHVDQRLVGHPRLEWLAKPVVLALRSTFDAVPHAERVRWKFLVPEPPPRRGPDDIAPIDPIPPGTRVWRVGPSGPLYRIADAARLAQSGDVVEIEAADYRGDVAVWNQTRLTIRGVNGAARLYADGQIAEGKAIWVIRHGSFDISNIDFVGAKAEDSNAAGIRFEGGRLHIRHCLFWGNEMGLLTSGGDHAQDSSLIVENSEFAYSSVENRWGHNLYVGTIDALTVVGSYFHHAGVGHLLKSRARRTEVSYSRLTDEAGGRASYEMEFPNGGDVRLVGNVVQQQAGTENSVVVSFGTEGYRWPVNTLVMSSNTLVNDHPHGGTFVRVAEGAGRVITANNLLVGPGGLQIKAPLTSFNDQRSDWGELVQPSRHDYRLRSPGPRFEYRQPPDPWRVDIPVPGGQYVHPTKVVPLPAVPRVVGADQRPAP